MHIHIHTYTRTHVHTYTHTHIHTYTHTHIHTYIHTHTHTHIRGNIHAYIHTYLCMYVCMYVCICNIHIYTDTHTYIRKHIHTHEGAKLLNHKPGSLSIPTMNPRIPDPSWGPEPCELYLGIGPCGSVYSAEPRVLHVDECERARWVRATKRQRACNGSSVRARNKARKSQQD